MSKDFRWLVGIIATAIFLMSAWGFNKISCHDRAIPEVNVKLDYIEKKIDGIDAKFDKLDKKIDILQEKIPRPKGD